MSGGRARQRRTTGADRLAGLSLLAAVVAGAGAAWGQVPFIGAGAKDQEVRAAMPERPRIDPYELSGRTFGGMRFPLAVTTGPIELAGQQVWTWVEKEAVGGAGRAAQRLYLKGEVRATVGPYTVTAKQACVWLERLPSGDPQKESDVWQVFAVLDQPEASERSGAITIVGGRLPVRGVIRAPAGVQLKADRMSQGKPEGEAFVGESERLLADRLRALLLPPAPGAQPEAGRGGEQRPDEDSLKAQRRLLEAIERRLGPADRSDPIFSPGGTVSFKAGHAAAVKDEGSDQDGKSVILSQGVSVQYAETRGDRPRTLQVSGESGVIFVEKSADTGGGAGGMDAASGLYNSTEVRGFYIEGDVVASDGEHTIRAPRVYYSVKENRAVLFDAVFWTYDERKKLPLYVRAATLEQLSTEQFRATDARLSNTPFFEPDLSIGASSVTITRKGEENNRGVLVDARNITLRAAGGVPFFYWPVLKGDPSAIPLKDLRVEDASGSGIAIRSRWNLYSLIGVEAPENVSADLRVDGFFRRGVGFGPEVKWGKTDGPVNGGIFGYILPGDRGTDVLPTGVRLDHEGDTRAFIYGEHRAELGGGWTLFAEGAYASDPTFVGAFFEPLARDHREFTNSFYVRRIEDDSMLFGEVRGRANNFIVNEFLLQTPGYSVEKYPDLGYLRLADDVIAAYPGLVTYSSSYRFTQMRMQFVDPTAKDLGFNTPFRSQSLFGILPGQSIADALRAQGLTSEPVGRFDTRHELSVQLGAGPLNITPFFVGRATAYDDTFESFSPKANEYYRLWGSAGVTVATELSKVDNAVESRLFDLHRIRHIIEPSVTVWSAATSVDRKDLPVFDDEVESLAEGSAIRFGLDQTWQTQRGGPGRWRSVDVFKLSVGVVMSSGDVDPKGPIGRWFDYQPELGNLGGNFATLEGSWQATEVLGFAGEEIYDFDLHQPARTAVGFTLQHDAEFSTFGGVRYINSQDQTYAIMGAQYDLTPKYSVSGSASYDTVRGEFQTVALEFRRQLPNVILGVSLTHNNITGVTSFGLVFQPVGVGGAVRAGGLGAGGGAGVGM